MPEKEIKLAAKVRGWNYEARPRRYLDELMEALAAGAKVEARTPWGAAKGKANSLEELAALVERAARQAKESPKWFGAELKIRGGGWELESTLPFEGVETPIPGTQFVARPGRELRLGIGYWPEQPASIPEHLALIDLPSSERATPEEVGEAIRRHLPELGGEAQKLIGRGKKWWPVLSSYLADARYWSVESSPSPH